MEGKSLRVKTEVIYFSDSDEETTKEKKKRTPIKKRKAEPLEKEVKRKKVNNNAEQKKPPIKRKKADPKKRDVEKKINKNVEPKNSTSEFSDVKLPIAKSEPSFDSHCSNIDLTRQWSDEEIVSENVDVPVAIVKNVISLLNQECTVPFIARYRKEMTGNLVAEKIREIQMSYENIKAVCKKADNIAKTLMKEGKDVKTIKDVINAKTMDEVEYLYAPFKPGSKRSLAERAKQLGLEPLAQAILAGAKTLNDINLAQYIDPNAAGLKNEAEIHKGIQNIIADSIAKDREILDFIRNNPQLQFVTFFASESATAKKEQKKAFIEGKETKNFKFENYFNFNMVVKNINAHQVMAINRGESMKILTVKLKMPSYFHQEIMRRCHSRFMPCKGTDEATTKFIDVCIKDAFDRLLEPHIFRQIRSELTKKAYKESVDVFCNNLKQLLLTPPVRGKTVMGIDPGFSHGCKVAIVSTTGDVLRTDVLYLHSHSKMSSYANEGQFINLVSTHHVNLIAIGNGTACRETELWLSELIKKGAFTHQMKYCIVNESGASIYSVTKEADADLPGMDPNIRSAVSIARRLQDPLLEYVKVEPKHLGVGMYQHDVPEAMLKSALDSVVVECVSFVGVDLNVCPEVLLRKISGLSAAKVKNIIQWREENGTFITRSQLLQVKGLGPKSYEQCVGFVKILPLTSIPRMENKFDRISENNTKRRKKTKKTEEFHPNLLDTTIIHPESYEIAEKFLIELKADHSEIGQQILIDKVKNYMKFTNVDDIAKRFNTDSSRLQLIINSFSQLMEDDIRKEFDVPLFQTGVTALTDLKVNQVLTGRVTNVTNFGAFVDIGVGQDGLIHVSKMSNQKVQLGNRVTVKVLTVDVAKKRIGLSLQPK